MTEDDSTPPVACTLTPERVEAYSKGVRTALGARFAGATEREDGYTLRFDGTDETLSAVATFVSNELECCSFAEYVIGVSPPYEETRLTITGPEGTKTMFRDGLIAQFEA